MQRKHVRKDMKWHGNTGIVGTEADETVNIMYSEIQQRIAMHKKVH